MEGNNLATFNCFSFQLCWIELICCLPKCSMYLLFWVLLRWTERGNKLLVFGVVIVFGIADVVWHVVPPHQTVNYRSGKTIIMTFLVVSEWHDTFQVERIIPSECNGNILDGKKIQNTFKLQVTSMETRYQLFLLENTVGGEILT